MLMNIWQPDAQLLRELVNLRVKNQEKENEFIGLSVRHVEEILGQKNYRLDSRQKKTYAKGAAHAMLHTFLTRGEWDGISPDEHLADQIVLHEIIKGNLDPNRKQQFVTSITSAIYEKNNKRSYRYSEELANEVWQECMQSILTQKFILTGPFKTYLKSFALNKLAAERRKQGQYRKYAAGIHSESDKKSPSEYKMREEVFDPLDDMMNELDVEVIKRLKMLARQCRDFINTRYSVDEQFRNEFDNIKKYTPEYRAFFDAMYKKGIKVNSIKKVSEILEKKPGSANKYAQTCLDSLVLKTHEGIASVLNKFSVRYGYAVKILRKSAEKRFLAAFERNTKHLENNRLYKEKRKQNLKYVFR